MAPEQLEWIRDAGQAIREDATSLRTTHVSSRTVLITTLRNLSWFEFLRI
jgi:hypothetical protein